MSIVLYEQGNGEYAKRKISVYYFIDGKYEPRTTIKIMCKRIANLLEYAGSLYVVLAVPDKIYKFTRSELKKLDVGASFSIHRWKKTLYIGTAIGEVSIVDCNSFKELSRHKILEGKQINSITNNDSTFAASFNTGISIFKHEADTIVNIKYIDLTSMNMRFVDYSKVLDDGKCIFHIRGIDHSNIYIDDVLIKKIKTTTGKILLVEGKEMAIASEDSKRIELYNDADVTSYVNIISVGPGLLKWINRLTEQWLFYTTKDSFLYYYYAFDRKTKNIILVDTSPIDYNVKMA